MLEVIDHTEECSIIYIKVGTCNQLEQNKSSILTVTTLGIVMITVEQESIFGINVMYNPGDIVRQILSEVLSV